MIIKFLAVMFILLEIYGLLNIRKIRKLNIDLEDEKLKTKARGENIIYILSSCCYMFYCFYLGFTSQWYIGAALIGLAVLISIIKNTKLKIFTFEIEGHFVNRLWIKLIDFALSVGLLAWVIWS